jgi:hypothetical protein
MDSGKGEQTPTWKVYEELVEKSQRCFNRLREIPPYVKFHWESYFHKAFHVYAKLWKYQQDHRCTHAMAALLVAHLGQLTAGMQANADGGRPEAMGDRRHGL